jgi:hypothetical protein
MLIVSATTGVAAGDEPCGCDPMPAPLHRAYRHEPEEEAIALLALERYFPTHHTGSADPVCVTLPGHRPPPRLVRDRLQQVGVTVDVRGECRFEEGRTIWAAAGVWRTGSREFVAHVIKSEFAHLSLFLEGYAYTLESENGAWRVVREKPSPCNQSAKGKPSSGSRASCAAAEQ